jgi:hypothetical protein
MPEAALGTAGRNLMSIVGVEIGGIFTDLAGYRVGAIIPWE